MAKKMNWTPDQLKAIDARGGTLIVSAAAGSGKTAVLVERCIRRLTDTEDQCSADQLLIVTFTRAATAEMRSRLAEAVVALDIIMIGGAELSRDERSLARDIVSGQAGKGVFTCVIKDGTRLVGDLIDQPRLTLLVGLGIDAVVPDRDSHVVMAVLHVVGHVHSVVDLIGGIVGVLAEGGQLAVQPNGIVGVRGDGLKSIFKVPINAASLSEIIFLAWLNPFEYS